MRSLALTALLLLPPSALVGQPADHGDNTSVILDDPVCDYGEDRPRLPTPGDSRAALYDLILGQELRAPQQALVFAALRRDHAGPASEAFIAIQQALPYDSDASIRSFEAIIARHRNAADPELRQEVARARWMLVRAWRSRHVGTGVDGHNLFVSETYKASMEGRRWSALLDAFLRDYRSAGPAFDEFVAEAEFAVIQREAADRTPGEHLFDPRLLQPKVRATRDAMRARLTALIARYRASPDERVQRVIADATDMFAPYDQPRAAMIPHNRALIARYRAARDVHLRAATDSAYEQLAYRLNETGDRTGAAAVEAEHRVWSRDRFDTSCAAPA